MQLTLARRLLLFSAIVAFALTLTAGFTANTIRGDRTAFAKNAATTLAKKSAGALNQEQQALIRQGLQQYDELWSLIMLLFSLGLTAPFMIYFFVRHQITKPLRTLSERTYALTNQDFDSDVPFTNRKDELGTLAFSLDILRHTYKRAVELDEARLDEARKKLKQKEAIEKLINDFRIRTEGVINVVSSASKELSSASEHILSSIDVAQRDTSMIGETMQKSAVQVKTACTHADSAFEAVVQISQSSDNAHKVSGDAQEVVNTAFESVSELAEATDKINGVTHLIRKITERINLLALNAGIESARAGEAGKGFVVVAQEVKVLAAQTKKATEEIIDHIIKLQEKAEATIDALNNVKVKVSRIREGNESAHSVIHTQRKVVNDLTYNMKAANTAMHTMHRNIETLTSAVNAVENVSKSVAETGRSLNVNASVLSQEVRKFLQEITTLQAD